jgi:hypothetical protein
MVILDAVYTELVVEDRGMPGAEEISLSVWILHESIRDPDATRHFPNILGQGVREAIVMTQDHTQHCS